MNKRDLNEAELESLFTLARTPRLEMSADFLASLQADASKAVASREFVEPVRKLSVFDAVKAWFPTGGLVAATAVGFWIGLSPPSSITGVSETLDALALFDARDDLETWFVTPGLDMFSEDG